MATNAVGSRHFQSEMEIVSGVESERQFPAADGDLVVDFDWVADPVVSGGRRRKHEKEKRRRTKPGTFGAMGLNAQLYRNITNGCKYKMPTPIQRKTIPLILQGLDLVGMARTGSGKTAAFIIPALQRLKGHCATVGARCLILSPSRELALQTYAVTMKLGKEMGFRIAVVVGGDALSEQFMQLAANPDIILATPGRLVHLLHEVKEFTMQSIEIAIFDEADRLFEMGFAEQIKEITHSMAPHRQTLLFSATMPRLLAEFTKAGLHDPEVIRLDTNSILPPDLSLHFLTVRHEDKPAALLYLLRSVLDQARATIVFCSTKHHVAFLHQILHGESMDSAFVYGAMDQSARKIQVAKFRNGVVSVLLVTDVAARGVDLPLIDNVIHYDFPPTPKLFVHRSGRTARAGRPGTAFSFVPRGDLPYLLDLHLFLSKPIQPAGDADEEMHVYGYFPPGQLALLSEVVQRRLQHSEELKALMQSAENGWKLCAKTRPAASTASVKRAKDLGEESLHPLFHTMTPQGEKDCEEFGRRLRTFRPASKVFQSQVANSRRDPPHRSSASTFKTQGAEMKLGRFRDATFYIPYERDDRHRESAFEVHSGVDGAVMDLMGEDQDSMVQQRRQYLWDRRSKRYICLQQGEKLKPGGKRIRMENGVKMDSKKRDAGKIYDSWTRNQKAKIQSTGAEEDARLTNRAAESLNEVGKKYKERKEISTGECPLTTDQIDKKRKLTEKQKWKNMPREQRKKTWKGCIQKRNARLSR